MWNVYLCFFSNLVFMRLRCVLRCGMQGLLSSPVHACLLFFRPIHPPKGGCGMFIFVFVFNLVFIRLRCVLRCGMQGLLSSPVHACLLFSRPSIHPKGFGSHSRRVFCDHGSTVTGGRSVFVVAAWLICMIIWLEPKWLRSVCLSVCLSACLS